MATYLEQIAVPGDRWELQEKPTSGRVRLGPAWDSVLAPEDEVLIDSDGGSVTARYELASHALVVSGSGAGLAFGDGGPAYLELVSLEPLAFRLLWEASPAVAEFPSETRSARDVEIAFPANDLAVVSAPVSPYSLFDLSRRAGDFAISRGFEELISLPLVHGVEPYDYQLRTVKAVLRRFRGRALLCDEVGLGKTVEAGLVLLELVARKLVRRVLILTPPSLMEQWQGEMRQKFGLEFITHDDTHFREQGQEAWLAFDHIIASYHTAKREPHRTAIAAQQWDMVIVDEAHHMRNRNTLLWKLAGSLRKRYILLLTATPLQNDLEELYNLVTLLQPGLLSTARHFRQTFTSRGDRLAPRNLDQLQSLLTEAMVRNRRSTVGVRFTRRFAQTLPVLPVPAERSLYQAVTALVRTHLRGQSALSRMSLITLQKEMGSCSLAAAPTLARLADGQGLSEAVSSELRALAEQARLQTESAKAERLLRLVHDFDDKLVVFTQFRASQDYLARVLAQAGDEPVIFHGGLPRLEKEAAIRAFRGRARVLLSTDSGSEGRNLQFCHGVCNFDLPWNPMRIEQRIGRLSRIGQAEDVYVFNLVSAGTLESALLHLLEAKVNLFEMVLGEMDMVLGNLDEEREFEDIVVDMWAEARDEAEFHQRMEDLGDRLAVAKEEYLRQRALDDRLFGDRLAPEG
jgi:SNF2 family DNA or RNA helicase